MQLPVIEWPGRHPARVARPRSPQERRRVENVLAIARLILASVAVSGAVVFADRAADTTLVDVRTLMFAYAAHSAIVATLVRYWPRPLGWWQLVFHVLDVLWAAMLTAATGGPNSPLFVL